MKKLTASALMLVSAYFVGSPAGAVAEDLPNDPRLKTGRLENGVRWMYRQHANPPGKMALMMRVDSGSLNETDSQRGLAHFIEHMCFNGTENFPPGTLIPYFESIGMEFGADLNAFTSFEQTSYMLFTPDTRQEQIDRALLVLSDYAFRALLTDEEINKERGVVLSEKRAGKSARQRVTDKLWPELYAGSRFAERMPIGTEHVLTSAPRSELADYYATWYRPENVTVMLVGDAPLDAVAPLIAKHFGSAKAAAPIRASHGAEFKPFSGQRAIVVSDPELAACEIEFYNLLPGRPPTTTRELLRTELIDGIGNWIMNRRLSERIKKGEASYRSASATVGSFFRESLLANASATGDPGVWERMLDELVVEVNRAREFGFTQRELDLARTDLLSDAERAVRTEPTQDARAILFSMNRAINEREPLLSAEQTLEALQAVLPTIRLEEVSAPLRTNYAPEHLAFVLTLPDKPGVVIPEREAVLAAAKAALARRPAASQEEKRATELLAAMPTPGTVAERQPLDEELGITSLWLDNGVRVHHRFMDYKKDTVMVSIALAGGQIEETAENEGITAVAGLVFAQPATRRLSSLEITDLMTGKNIAVRGGSAGDSITIVVTGSPKDLESGLQLAFAILTEGKLEESAFNTWKQRTLQQIDGLQKRPEYKATEALLQMISGGDPRMTPMTRERVEKQSVVASQAWLERICSTAPIEVAVVGELSLDAALPLVERYIGSLPKRARTASQLDALRKLKPPIRPLVRKVDVDTMTPRAMATAGFMSCDARNIADARALAVASNILSSRLVKRIREELALVYSINAQSQPGIVFDDSGLFMSGAPCDPGKSAEVVAEVERMFREFAEAGPTAEELDNAKKQIANNLDVARREPNYWFNMLQHLELHRVNFAERKADAQRYAEMTAEQVRDAFRKYCIPERLFYVTAVPTHPQAAEEPTSKPVGAPG
jgi:zinc protease